MALHAKLTQPSRGAARGRAALAHRRRDARDPPKTTGMRAASVAGGLATWVVDQRPAGAASGCCSKLACVPLKVAGTDRSFRIGRGSTQARNVSCERKRKAWPRVARSEAAGLPVCSE